MKMIRLLLILLLPAFSFAQSKNQALFDEGSEAVKAGEYEKSVKIFDKVLSATAADDALHHEVLKFYPAVLMQIVREEGNRQNWKKAVKFGVKAEEMQTEGEKYFSGDSTYMETRNWINQGLLVTYAGLGQAENVKKYKSLLYKAHQEKKLPVGIDQSFYFDQFKWNKMIVWAVESYEDQPMKYNYYVYSEDPADNALKCTVSVLEESDSKYVLVLYFPQGYKMTLHQYKYQQIDFATLKKDVLTALDENYREFDQFPQIPPVAE